MRATHTLMTATRGRGLLRLFCAVAIGVGLTLPLLAQGGQPQQRPSPQQASPAGPLQPQAPSATGEDAEGEWTHWTSGRYRITPGDVIEVRFQFVPELDQTLVVQPDGYVTLREAGDLRVQGRTIPQFRDELREAYESLVREPAFTVVLKEFEKPYFVAAGEIRTPGRYDLRGATTLTQALAYAGGPTAVARMSEVVIFRYHSEETVSVKQINVKDMYSKRDLSEDPLLQPGDTIYIPKSTLGKLAPILSRVSAGIFFNPFQR